MVFSWKPDTHIPSLNNTHIYPVSASIYILTYFFVYFKGSVPKKKLIWWVHWWAIHHMQRTIVAWSLLGTFTHFWPSFFFFFKFWNFFEIFFILQSKCICFKCGISIYIVLFLKFKPFCTWLIRHPIETPNLQAPLAISF